MLNGALGLGILLEAKDAASGVLGQFGNKLLRTKGISEEATEAIKGHMRGLGVGFGLFAAGALGLVALAQPLALAEQYGHELGQIRTIVDETAFSTAALEDATMELSAVYGGSAIKQANSLYEVISAGVTDAAKATDLLNIANQFAIGGAAELKAGVDVLTSAVNTYGDVGLTAKDASDSLFLAVAAGKTTASELAHSLGEVAPTAHALGVSFDELTGSIAALTVQGVKTPQAVTGMSALLSNIAKPTKEAAQEAARLGIEFNTTALKSKGLAGFLAQLSGNTKVNDDSFSKLFGSIDGIKTAFTLTAGGGAKLNEVLEQMKGKSGATQKAFDIMADTAKFQSGRLVALKDDALTLIGQALEPLAASVMKVASSILEAFMSIPAPIREFIVKGFAVASALATVVGGAIAARAAFGLLRFGMAALGVSIGGVLATLWPVALVIGVVTLAVAAFRQAYEHNLGGFGTMVQSGVAKAQLAFQALGQLFSDGGFSGKVRDELNKADNAGLKNFVIRVYVTVRRIQHLFSELGKGFSKVIDAAAPSFAALVDALGALGKAFGGLTEANDADKAAGTYKSFGSVGERLGGILGKLAVVVVKIATAFVNIATTIVTVADKFGGLEKVVTVLGTAFVAYKIGAAIQGIGVAAGSATGTVGALVAALGGLVLLKKTLAEENEVSDGHGLSNMWTNFKHSVGITSDEEFDAERMAKPWADNRTQKNALDEWNNRFASAATQVPPEMMVSLPPPQVSVSAFPAVAAQQAQQEAMGPRVEPADLTAAVASGVSKSPAPITTVTVVLGDETVAQATGRAQSSSDFRSGYAYAANM